MNVLIVKVKIERGWVVDVTDMDVGEAPEELPQPLTANMPTEFWGKITEEAQKLGLDVFIQEDRE